MERRALEEGRRQKCMQERGPQQENDDSGIKNDDGGKKRERFLWEEERLLWWWENDHSGKKSDDVSLESDWREEEQQCEPSLESDCDERTTSYGGRMMILGR